MKRIWPCLEWKACFYPEARSRRLPLPSDAGDLRNTNKQRRGPSKQPQLLVPRDGENEELERKIAVKEIKPSEGYIF